MKKRFRVITTAALAGMLISGAAGEMASSTAHAEQGKAPAVFGAAAPKAVKSIKQDGITLGVSQAMYDGNYIKVTLQRSGQGLDGGVAEGEFDEKTQDMVYKKGAIKRIEFLIDGKKIENIGKNMGERPIAGWSPGSTPDQAEINIVDPSWLGGQQFTFANKFKLTVKVTLQGVAKPYTFDLAMQKSAGTPIALKPNLSKKSGNLTVNFSKLNATSTSTRVQLIEKGLPKNKPSDISYEFVDDQGKVLKLISGFGSDQNTKTGDMYNDYVLAPLGKNVKSITLKAYKPEFEETGATTGAYKLDENGQIIKHYVKEIEMTVKVK
ncbi:hypothetical protein DCC85_03350 [Paenibacillus sp. CAA11]|nr:hypothetical protein DCC85_03350 [Paenibacillus sp. CAA11]